MTSPSQREEIPQSDNPPLPNQTKAKRLKPKTQRLVLSGAGFLMLAGLGALAALYTAPFADPPEKNTKAPASIVPPSAARPMDKPSLPGTTASEALRQLTLNAQKQEASRTGAQPKTEVPPPDDPRWAKTETAPSPNGNPPPPPVADTSKDPGTETNTILAAPLEELLRGSPTAMMDEQTSPADAPPPSEILVEPVDQASLPVLLAPASDGMATAAISPNKPEADEPKAASRQEAVPPPRSNDAPSSNVTVTANSKMRDQPSEEAAVVAFIPDKAVVGLVKCASWCEVVYRGRRGFVYKGLIDGRGVTDETLQQAPVPAAAEEPKGPKAEPSRAVDLNSIGR